MIRIAASRRSSAVCALLALTVALAAVPASAQEAPPPHRAPRTPVSRELISEARHDSAPASRQVSGIPTVMDGEKLRVGETDVRLFGIVPPQLAASFGPQARGALDALAGGQPVTCAIRDRDRDGRLLAVCRTISGADMALELLKRGLAVSARGTLANTDFSAPYLAAEQAAQAQHLGLWSVSIPAAAKDIPAAPQPTPQAAPKDDKPTTSETAAPPPAPVVPAPTAAKPAEKATTPPAKDAKDAAESLSAAAQARIDDTRWSDTGEPGFFERYQLLIAGLLMLGTALSLTGAMWSQKRRDKRDETKALAAALRGELMAGRSICLGRIKSIKNEEEDRAAAWPRIRSTLYAAYVGRIGLLGAELARLISSIYGQSSDYTALYGAGGVTTPKKQALETLVKHIDDVLPRLAVIEQTGKLVSAADAARFYATAVASSIAAQQYQIAPPPRPRMVAAPPQGSAASAPPAAAPQPAGASPTAMPAPSPAIASATEPAMAAAPLAPALYGATAPQSGGLAASVAQAPGMLWEAVRQFIQSHRSPAAAAPDAQQAYDPGISDYAAMIEADMARYQYGDSVETTETASVTVASTSAAPSVSPQTAPTAKPSRAKSGG